MRQEKEHWMTGNKYAKKPNPMNRSMGFFCTDEDREFFIQKAKAAKKSLSEWIRWKLKN